MEITRDTSGDLLEMRLKGALDNESSIHFRTAIEEVTRDGWHRILVDLENLSYISSAGINALLLASKRIKSLKGQFGAHSPPPSVAKVLRLTKLYDVLIIDPADFRIDDTSASMIMNVNAKRFTRNRAIDLELYSLQPSEPMTCSIYGSPGILHCAQKPDPKLHTVAFGTDSFGLGIGALSAASESDESRLGEIVAMAGSVAQSASETGLLPDYSVARGEFVPSADLLYGVKLEGQYSTLVRFQSSDPGAAIQLSTLLQSCLEEMSWQTAAVTILADCSGLLGAQMRRWNPSPKAGDPFEIPSIRDWISFCPEHSNQHKLALVVGIVTRQFSTLPDALKAFLRPLNGDENQAGHFHAAVFPYQPLKKRTIDLHGFISNLFDSSEIQEVLHLLKDSRPTRGESESEFRNGACWLEPIDHSLMTEVL